MPALHVVGEIVGASGLRPREALSAAHWLDVWSLHSSSSKSFFCRWRLAFRAFGACDTSDLAPSWRVLQGASRGQTQVHAWSALTPLEGESITTSSQHRRRPPHDDEDHEPHETTPPLELETLWSHPIDLHLAVGELPPLPTSWPFLEFQVWSLDEFHRERLVGTASLPLPAAQHEFFVDLPLTKLVRSSSIREAAAEWLDLKHDDVQWGDNLQDDEEGEEDDDEEEDGYDNQHAAVATSVGSLYVRLAVIPQDLAARGVLS